MSFESNTTLADIKVNNNCAIAVMYCILIITICIYSIDIYAEYVTSRVLSDLLDRGVTIEW